MSERHTGRQHNIYFGKSERDDAAYDIVQKIGTPISDLFKQVLLQIADGSLKVDPLTLRVDAKNDDLYRMVKEIHQVIKSGQLRLVTEPQSPDTGDGIPEVVVSREVMNAFNEMDD